MNTKLSIVLPLKGREEFTARFLKAAVPIGKVVVADGSAVPLMSEKYHGGFDCDYFYAGHDTTLHRWWTKMVLAFDRVRTPYAMVADNDDLLNADGINRCVEFLDKHPDYIACSGRLQGFWMWPDPVHGPRTAGTKRYALYDVPADYGQRTASERVLAGFQNSWSYYAVYRTEALKTIWGEVHDINLSDLQVHEKFCAMRALTLGKVMGDHRFVSYRRQYGTSTVAGHNTDFAANLMRTNFSADREAIMTRMWHCGVDIDALRYAWAQWYDAYLRRNYGSWASTRKTLKARYPRLGQLAQQRHRFLPLRWSYR
jgi:glycosyltransferase domain-containing protein